MNPRFVTCTLLAVLTVTGCATGASGPTDEELIGATVNEWKTALVAHDIETLMTTYSESFSDGDGNNKATLKTYLTGVVEQGTLDNVEVDTAMSELVIDGDSATYGPIALSSNAGAIGIDLTLAREGEKWMIVNMVAG